MDPTEGPRMLHLDIETAPNVAHVWGFWDVNVSPNQVLATGYVLCFSAKWHGEKGRPEFWSVHHDGRKAMLDRLHALMDEADIVCTYNGIAFDVPTVNKEFLIEQMPPPAPFKQVDLLRAVRRIARFPSNKLDSVARELGLGGKVKHAGHQLWIDCMAGDEAAWRKMKSYNQQDVVLLEKLYNRMLPWIPNHPNVGLHASGAVCSSCGSTRLQSRGVARTTTQTYQRYQCNDCGKWNRGSKALPGRRPQVVAAA